MIIRTRIKIRFLEKIWILSFIISFISNNSKYKKTYAVWKFISKSLFKQWTKGLRCIFLRCYQSIIEAEENTLRLLVVIDLSFIVWSRVVYCCCIRMDVRTLEKERIAVRNRDAMITPAKEKPLACLPIIVSLFGFILFIT